MKDNPVLYRKRMIPEECVLLKDDKVLESRFTPSTAFVIPSTFPSSSRLIPSVLYM